MAISMSFSSKVETKIHTEQPSESEILTWSPSIVKNTPNKFWKQALHDYNAGTHWNTESPKTISRWYREHPQSPAQISVSSSPTA